MKLSIDRMPTTYRVLLALFVALIPVTSVDNPESSPPTTSAAMTTSPLTTIPRSDPDEGSTESIDVSSATPGQDAAWKCPNVTGVTVECSCDFPHTLRCTGDETALQAIGDHLKRSRPGTISLLDITVSGISTLPAHFLESIALHGLVVSTGELRRVNESAFTALTRPLQALGLPNNLLDAVPTDALRHLVGLDRLDLSRNKLKTLEEGSFKGLTNLTHLDLCDNLLSQLSPQAFAALPMLRSLRMRGNRLSVSALSALRGLHNLEELDLSGNVLMGPLGPDLLPPMSRLRFLTVSQNELNNVRQGALAGLRNLTYLNLGHNQIDVLEDHSFKHLSALTRLDLANNRIVAVSSASLAHLERLLILDLTHNFLRSLTADLIVPLRRLQDLRLDDNDITMVESDVLASNLLHLRHLSLADNPLNCDCTLLEFANWLGNSSLDDEDKSSAVCATPPALENGVLTQVSPGSLLCGDPTPPQTRVPLAGAQLFLKEFRYDDAAGINLLWQVEPCSERYMCDTLIVYETVGDSEIQMESSPLHCDSRLMRDPCSLPIAIPTSVHLRPGHRYRYCVVLLVPTEQDNGDVPLGLGCSDVITLEETATKQQQREEFSHGEDRRYTSATRTLQDDDDEARITAVHVNVTDQGLLHVGVSLLHAQASADCAISVTVFAVESIVRRKRLNCSAPFVTLEDVLPRHYKVCASLEDEGQLAASSDASSDVDWARLHCVEVQALRQNLEVIVLSIVAALCAVIVIFVLIGRTLARRKRHPRIQAQCFMPAQEFEITHKAHYIKLLATTKV